MPISHNRLFKTDADPRKQPAHMAGLRNGDLVRKRDPLGVRVILALSMLLVVFFAVKLFAHTVDEVRVMERHIEGFP